MLTDNQCLISALAAFPYKGKIVGFKPFGSGHINDTYAIYLEAYPEARIGYILQRLNIHVFKKPREVMENIMGVTEYIHNQLEIENGDIERGVLHFLKTKEGHFAFYDEEGMPWRSYRYIENSFCYDQSPTPEVFFHSGCAFGKFLQMLDEYPADTLHETIPDFHNTPARFKSFESAVNADSMGRVANCRQEIEFLMNREKDCSLLVNMQQAGDLPLRVTHNDTKLNNVLFDSGTGAAICVIDLDTIMPGLALNDFGDSIRFGATTATEDEPDLTKVRFSLQLFEAYTKGYLQTAGGVLTPEEKRMLPQGARIITLECGMRFLTDYLEGDTYFKTEHPEQNLDRARTQLKLVDDMEHQLTQMNSIIEKYS